MERLVKRLDLETHREYGNTLKNMRLSLMLLEIEASITYGKTSKARKLAHKAYEAIDALRCELDNCLARETTMEQWCEMNLPSYYYGEDTRKAFTAHDLLTLLADVAECQLLKQGNGMYTLYDHPSSKGEAYHVFSGYSIKDVAEYFLMCGEINGRLRQGISVMLERIIDSAKVAA